MIKKLDSSIKEKDYLSTFERAILNIISAFEIALFEKEDVFLIIVY